MLAAFQTHYATGAQIYSTTFIDRHGRFAKSWEELDRVVIDFRDGAAYELTADQFSSLPLDTRRDLQTQQSGNVPNPLASNA